MNLKYYMYICTYVTGKLPLSIAVSELAPGVNTLEIVLSDAAGDTDRYAANITVGGGTGRTLFVTMQARSQTHLMLEGGCLN